MDCINRLNSIDETSVRLKKIIAYVTCVNICKNVTSGDLRIDPFKYAIEKCEGFKSKDRVYWFKRKDDHEINGVEMSAHGDVGINDSYGSLSTVEKGWGSAVIGHAHTVAIMRQIFRVGTSGIHDYGKGPSIIVVLRRFHSCLIAYGKPRRGFAHTKAKKFLYSRRLTLLPVKRVPATL